MAHAQPVQLRIAYEDKDTPDHTGASTLVPAHPGILVEMVAQLGSRVPNVRVSFSRKPWSRCLAELEVGAADAMRGYAIVAKLRKMGVPVSEVDRQENAFRMLLVGRLDGFVQLGTEGDYSLKTHPEFKRIVKVAPPVTTRDYYLQISHQFQAEHPELTLEIWKALAAIRQAKSERLTLKYMKAYSE